jgi:TolB protein
MGKEFAAPMGTARTSRRAFILATGLQALALTIGQAEQSVNAPSSGARAIALPEFVPNSPDLRDIAHEMTSMVAEELKLTGRFELLNSSAWTGMIAEVDKVPLFDRWRAAGARFLITGNVKMSGNRLRSECRAWDIESKQQLVGQRYYSRPDDWPRVAHGMADAISNAI